MVDDDKQVYLPAKLSPNFSLAELCVTNQPFPNTPPPFALGALVALCVNVLEVVRAHFKKKYPHLKIAVIVTSGYRSDRVNAAVGGAETSQHRLGEAADIHIPGVSNAEIWDFIVNGTDEKGKPLVQFDQVIAERLKKSDGSAGWVHVSYRAGRLRRSAISFLGKPKGYVPGLQYVDGISEGKKPSVVVGRIGGAATDGDRG